MILFCDENISPLVAQALNARGFGARSFRDMGWLGVADVDWLTYVGQETDVLVFTCDIGMVRNRGERSAIVHNRVGIVFFTSSEEPADKIIDVLTSNWERLEEIHTTAPRPFAWFLTPDGQMMEEHNGQRLRR